MIKKSHGSRVLNDLMEKRSAVTEVNEILTSTNTTLKNAGHIANHCLEVPLKSTHCSRGQHLNDDCSIKYDCIQHCKIKKKSQTRSIKHRHCFKQPAIIQKYKSLFYLLFSLKSSHLPPRRFKNSKTPRLKIGK